MYSRESKPEVRILGVTGQFSPLRRVKAGFLARSEVLYQVFDLGWGRGGRIASFVGSKKPPRLVMSGEGSEDSQSNLNEPINT